ncbi:MAG: hypothetical protein KBC34_08900 [Phenylobacterium sp.]|nr:hypothetical protein [Phenylobacterium sp.]
MGIESSRARPGVSAVGVVAALGLTIAGCSERAPRNTDWALLGNGAQMQHHAEDMPDANAEALYAYIVNSAWDAHEGKAGRSIRRTEMDVEPIRPMGLEILERVPLERHGSSANLAERHDRQ